MVTSHRAELDFLLSPREGGVARRCFSVDFLIASGRVDVQPAHKRYRWYSTLLSQKWS